LSDIAIRTGTEEDIRVAMRSSLGLAEGDEIDEALMARFTAFCRWMWRPYWHDGPFNFAGLGYFHEGVGQYIALARARLSTPWLPMSAFISRWYFGLVAMLLRLRARVDVRAVYWRERNAAGWGPA